MSADLERRIARLEQNLKQLDRRLTMEVAELRSQVLRLSGYKKPVTEATDETVEQPAEVDDAKQEAS